MHRVQVQLTPEQARALKRLATREGKSVAELIQLSAVALLQSKGFTDPDAQRQKAILAAGKLSGKPDNLAAEYNHFLTQVFDPSAFP